MMMINKKGRTEMLYGKTEEKLNAYIEELLDTINTSPEMVAAIAELVKAING